MATAANPLDVKQAAVIAIRYVKELIPDASDLALEEVEMSERGNQWFVTVGFRRPDPNNFRAVLGQTERVYKQLAISRDTGEVVSMKIRTP